MEWFTLERLDQQTVAISEYGHWEKVRSFLLMGQKEALLIDTGLGIGSIKDVIEGLTDLPIRVVLTHVHWDHIGGVGEFDNCNVHPLDQEWLEQGIPVWDTVSVRKELMRELSQPLPADFDISRFELFKGCPTGHLLDSMEIDLGGRKVRVIHTPGHSPGHVSFIDTNGYLFPGDCLYSSETPIYGNYPSTSPQDLVRSLEKLANLPGIQRIFGSHNQLEIWVSSQELRDSVTYLRENDLVRHGTGLHQFRAFSLLF